MHAILKTLLDEFIIVVVFVMAPAVLLHLWKLRSRKKVSDHRKKVFSVLSKLDASASDFSLSLQKQTASLREGLVQLAKSGIVSHDKFVEHNGTINEHANLALVRHFEHLLADVPALGGRASIVLADDKITQAEILYFIDAIEKCEDIPTADRTALTAELTETYSRTKVDADGHELYSRHGMDDLAIQKTLKFAKVAAFAIPIIAVASILYSSLSRPTVRFGAIGYVSREKFEDISSRMEDYLSESTGSRIVIRYFSYDEADTARAKIEAGELDGLILNPGTFRNYSENHPEVFNTMEAFCFHKESGTRSYRSVIATRRSSFNEFLEENKLDFECEDPSDLSEDEKLVVAEYLLAKGHITFTHRNSMSGAVLPRYYLWREFGIDVNGVAEQRARHGSDAGAMTLSWSGAHDESIRRIIEGEAEVVITYNTLLKEMLGAELGDILTLYESPEIPFNSYWIRKDVQSAIKGRITRGFVAMSDSRFVAANDMHIDEWVACSSEEYFELMKPLNDLLNGRRPKPIVRVVMNHQSEETAGSVASEFTRLLQPCDAWDIEKMSEGVGAVTERPDTYGKVKEFTVRMELNGVSNKRHGVLYVYFSNQNSDTVEEPLKIDLDELVRKTGDATGIYTLAAGRIASGFANRYSVKPIVHFDKNGYFLNVGFSDGLKHCELSYNEAVIPSDEYEIESSVTRFHGNDAEWRERKNKRVKIVYTFLP